MKWIKVSESLPEPGIKVLFCSQYEIGAKKTLTLGWYRPKKDEDFPWRDGFGSGDGPSVTHWAEVEYPND